MTTATRKSAPSPCKAVCVMNIDTGFCVGCYRAIEEIAGWTMMSHERRLEVLDAVAQRRTDDEATRQKSGD